MYKTVSTLEDYQKVIETEKAVLVYFSHEECNVCKVLKPKVLEAIKEEFPKIELYYIDTKLNPEISGQQRIFTVPTILVYFETQESLRMSRNIGINDLCSKLQRSYEILFN